MSNQGGFSAFSFKDNRSLLSSGQEKRYFITTELQEGWVAQLLNLLLKCLLPANVELNIRIYSYPDYPDIRSKLPKNIRISEITGYFRIIIRIISGYSVVLDDSISEYKIFQVFVQPYYCTIVHF